MSLRHPAGRKTTVLAQRNGNPVTIRSLTPADGSALAAFARSLPENLGREHDLLILARPLPRV